MADIGGMHINGSSGTRLKSCQFIRKLNRDNQIHEMKQSVQFSGF